MSQVDNRRQDLAALQAFFSTIERTRRAPAGPVERRAVRELRVAVLRLTVQVAVLQLVAFVRGDSSTPRPMAPAAHSWGPRPPPHSKNRRPGASRAAGKENRV